MRPYLLVSGAIFGIIALLHLWRLFSHWPVVIGPLTLPRWGSVAGLAVAGTLAFWAFRLALRLPPGDQGMSGRDSTRGETPVPGVGPLPRGGDLEVLRGGTERRTRSTGDLTRPLGSPDNGVGRDLP